MKEQRSALSQRALVGALVVGSIIFGACSISSEETLDEMTPADLAFEYSGPAEDAFIIVDVADLILEEERTSAEAKTDDTQSAPFEDSPLRDPSDGPFVDIELDDAIVEAISADPRCATMPFVDVYAGQDLVDVGDLDNDGVNEVVWIDNESTPPALAINGSQSRQITFLSLLDGDDFSASHHILTTADIDGDGQAELFVEVHDSSQDLRFVVVAQFDGCTARWLTEHVGGSSFQLEVGEFDTKPVGVQCSDGGLDQFVAHRPATGDVNTSGWITARSRYLIKNGKVVLTGTTQIVTFGDLPFETGLVCPVVGQPSPSGPCPTEVLREDLTTLGGSLTQDVDGDGVDDEIFTMRTDTGEWVLGINFGGGGSTSLDLPPGVMSGVGDLLGSYDIGDDGSAEIFVTFGGSAGIRTFAIASLDTCVLRWAILGGQPATFDFGVSRNSIADFTCEFDGELYEDRADVLEIDPQTGDPMRWQERSTPFDLVGWSVQNILVRENVDSKGRTVSQPSAFLSGDFQCGDIHIEG